MRKIHRNVSKTPHVRINRVFFGIYGFINKEAKEAYAKEKTSKDVKENACAKTTREIVAIW